MARLPGGNRLEYFIDQVQTVQDDRSIHGEGFETGLELSSIFSIIVDIFKPNYKNASPREKKAILDIVDKYKITLTEVEEVLDEYDLEDRVKKGRRMREKTWDLKTRW